MKLIVTFPPTPTESISGYLHRLTLANGYDKPSWIGSLYTSTERANHYKNATVADLVSIAGISTESAHRLVMSPGSPGSRATTMLLGKKLSSAEVDTQNFRICPLCVAQKKEHQAIWHLTLMGWCPEHRVRLADRCRACKRQALWNRPKLEACMCGAGYQANTAGKCSVQLAELLRVIERSLVGSHNGLTVPRRYTHLGRIDFVALTKLIRVLASVLRCPMKPSWQNGGRALESNDLEDVAEMLSNWPYNFQRRLDELYRFKFKPEVVRFRQVFGWAYLQLGKHLRELGPQLDFVRAEVIAYGSSYWSRDYLVRNCHQAHLGCLPSKWGSIPEAARILRISSPTLLTRLKKGLVPYLEAPQYRYNRRFRIDLEWARREEKRSRVELADRVSVLHAARYWQINAAVATRLITKFGIFEIESLGRKTFISRRATEQLQRILDRVLPALMAPRPMDLFAKKGKFAHVKEPIERAAILVDLVRDSVARSRSGILR